MGDPNPFYGKIEKQVLLVGGEELVSHASLPLVTGMCLLRSQKQYVRSLLVNFTSCVLLIKLLIFHR